MHLLGHSWGGSLAAAYVLEKGTEGIASVILSSPLLSTSQWIADANFLRSQLPADVQQTLTEHEAAGTTDSEEYAAASEVFYERHMYAGDRIERPAECEGAPRSKFVYEYMWGPSEFHADGTLVDFDVTGRLHEIDVPVLFLTGQFDEIEGPPFHCVFIRAPGVDKMGKDVRVLAKLEDGRPIAVRQGTMLATSFHPELTDDTRIHDLFIKIIQGTA